MTEAAGTPSERYWEEFYRGRGRAWSGKPNWLLVREVSDLSPGTALDLGCGEGGDAIWLASRGWRVTAVDVSVNALARGADHAADAGVAEAIEWERHDLGVSFPSGSFALVSTHYLHSPVELPRERVLLSAAAAVEPGGTLLIVGHASSPSSRDPHPEVHFPTPQEVLEHLALPPGQWDVECSDFVTRELLSPAGEPATRTDSLLKVARLGADETVRGHGLQP